MKMAKFFIVLALVCFVLLGTPKVAQADANSASRLLEEQVLQVIRNHPEVVVQSIQDYQRQQQDKQQQVRDATLQELKSNPEKFIAESPTEGEFSQNILIEFSDFQCVYCAKVRTTLNRFMTKHKNDVKLVYKHYPLSQIHPEAMAAARAAWAAGQQGEFWQYHNALFENQNNLSDPLYIRIAKKLQLDIERFDRDRNDDNANDTIQKDVELAEKLGIMSTPFFVLNGETFSGAVQLSELESLLTRSQQSVDEAAGKNET